MINLLTPNEVSSLPEGLNTAIYRNCKVEVYGFSGQPIIFTALQKMSILDALYFAFQKFQTPKSREEIREELAFTAKVRSTFFFTKK